MYMNDLLLLDACLPTEGESSLSSLYQPRSESQLASWRRGLASFPDSRFSSYVLDGLSNGFRIGFNRELAAPPKARRRNMPSVRENAAVVDQYVRDEIQEGRLVGPISAGHSHVSPIGLIPKSHQPGEWRLIVDLSSPEGSSVNDGISCELCSLRYASLDDAVEIIRELGQGALLAKLDLRKAYRMVPVHPSDHWLLGIFWQGCIYLDRTLPFGLRSAPKIFTAVADALAWVIMTKGVRWLIHYMNDFLFFGPPGSGSCLDALLLALKVCLELCCPVAPNKVEVRRHHWSSSGLWWILWRVS